MAIKEILVDLKEREREKLEGQISDLDRIYRGLPELIKRTAELTGMDEETLIRCCVSATELYRDITWREALDIIRSFYQAKGRLEADKSYLTEKLRLVKV